MQTRNLLLYNTTERKVNISVYFQDGTFWLTQKAMAEMFGVNVPAVSKHLRNIFGSGELDIASTVSILETVQKEGPREVTVLVGFYRIKPMRVILTGQLKNWINQKISPLLHKDNGQF